MRSLLSIEFNGGLCMVKIIVKMTVKISCCCAYFTFGYFGETESLTLKAFYRTVVWFCCLALCNMSYSVSNSSPPSADRDLLSTLEQCIAYVGHSLGREAQRSVAVVSFPHCLGMWLTLAISPL